MGTLSLTFRGPFLFVVPLPGVSGPSPTVNIYAPQCAGHLGSVFSGNRSFPIYGRAQQGGLAQIYTLTGVAPASGNISFQWDYASFTTNPIVSPDLLATVPPYPATFPGACFCITVPRPRIFYGTDVVSDTAVIGFDQATLPAPFRTTSFRLYFDWDLVTPIVLAPPLTVRPANQPYVVTPPVAGPPAGTTGWYPLPDHADIEFGFEPPESSDADHQDANSCFAQLAGLAGLPWYLDYDYTGGGGGGAAFRTGSDCHALPIVLGYNN